MLENCFWGHFRTRRAAVHAWLAEYCIQILAVLVSFPDPPPKRKGWSDGLVNIVRACPPTPHSLASSCRYTHGRRSFHPIPCGIYCLSWSCNFQYKFRSSFQVWQVIGSQLMQIKTDCNIWPVSSGVNKVDTLSAALRKMQMSEHVEH